MNCLQPQICQTDACPPISFSFIQHETIHISARNALYSASSSWQRYVNRKQFIFGFFRIASFSLPARNALVPGQIFLLALYNIRSQMFAVNVIWCLQKKLMNEWQQKEKNEANVIVWWICYLQETSYDFYSNFIKSAATQ